MKNISLVFLGGLILLTVSFSSGAIMAGEVYALLNSDGERRGGLNENIVYCCESLEDELALETNQWLELNDSIKPETKKLNIIVFPSGDGICNFLDEVKKRQEKDYKNKYGKKRNLENIVYLCGENESVAFIYMIPYEIEKQYTRPCRPFPGLMYWFDVSKQELRSVTSTGY